MRATAQIFLSYAREDRERVESLYQRLSDAGFKPWMDTKDVLPGERWESSIQKAIRRSDFFLTCLSTNSVSKRGYLQKEIKNALDIWQEKLEDDIYLIPVRLEDCEVPESLRDFQWVDLFEVDGWTLLVKAIQVGMERRGEVIECQEPTLLESYPDHEKPSRRVANVERLIKDIQSALYGDNSRLPYVLTLCLDLCDQVDLSEEYGEWLRRELKGYEDYKEFLDDEGQFDAWMQRWASHRAIRPYIQGMIYSKERMRPEILKLPIKQFLVAFPVAEIARMIQDARGGGGQEFSHSLLSLGQEHFAELQAIFAKLSPGVEVPPDVQIFYSIADLEKVLNGVRGIVLSLLSDARQRIAER